MAPVAARRSCARSAFCVVCAPRSYLPRGLSTFCFGSFIIIFCCFFLYLRYAMHFSRDFGSRSSSSSKWCDATRMYRWIAANCTCSKVTMVKGSAIVPAFLPACLPTSLILMVGGSEAVKQRGGGLFLPPPPPPPAKFSLPSTSLIFTERSGGRCRHDFFSDRCLFYSLPSSSSPSHYGDGERRRMATGKFPSGFVRVGLSLSQTTIRKRRTPCTCSVPVNLSSLSVDSVRSFVFFFI